MWAHLDNLIDVKEKLSDLLPANWLYDPDDLEGLEARFGVVPVEILREPLEWWQHYGSPEIDGSARPVTISYRPIPAEPAPELVQAHEARARAAARQRVLDGYQQARAQGFQHDGKTWSLSPEAAERMVRMAIRVTGFNELPRGRTTRVIRDITGAPHELDLPQIKALVRAGHDEMDALDEQLDDLLASVEAADVGALAGIDWPEQ